MKKPHHTSDPDAIKGKGKGYEIFPKGLNIVWGDDTRYWNLAPDKEGAATLTQVSWLDVSCVVNVTPGNKYRVSFEVELKPDAFGWSGSPVLVMAKVGKRGNYSYKEVHLNNIKSSNVIPPQNDSLEIEVGEEASENKLYFGLYEVWSGKWKGGLVIRKANVECV